MALVTRSLFGRRVALHGFGRINRELIHLLRPFDVEITAYSDGVPGDYVRSFNVQPVENLRAFSAGTDVLVTCEALTDQTRHSIDFEVLSALPVSAVAVNVGRGTIIDEGALSVVARERNVRVALDVFENEPP